MFYLLHEHFGFFRLFEYVTFRAAMAGFTAMVVGFLVAPKLLEILRHMRQPERDKRLMGDLAKEGGKVPTMGGLIILAAVFVSTLLWARLDNSYVWAALIVYGGMSAVGYWDDYKKVVLKSADGISGRQKMAGQAVSALAAFVLLVSFPESRAKMCELWAPFVKNPIVSAESPLQVRERLEQAEDFRRLKPEIRAAQVAARSPLIQAPSSGVWAVLVAVLAAAFFCLVAVGSSNAVNLTDGLDGLAIGCVITTALTFGVTAYLAGHREFADYLMISPVRNAGELAVICSALLGGSFVFLWYNAAPAEVYMGDVGALGLGGLIGAIAFMINQPFLLVIVGLVFVVEALSVMIQVAYFKRTGGRRIFLMTPIHHHFQKKGWPVTKIVTRFWLLSLLCAIVGLISLKLR